ncbi:Tim10/DDP family zinc finger-domain-containing protein [Roridomyces roridus]|uniref:Mitochondrial import inner membrane translocase subunit n=1 Tax=Roridomyces roridus TaxID=1738132 RepID=A0AAD7CJC2_9AGAR|nr:Tim10/DDP family zinc finger-domain-containing protein [Roridomyces roridus]
MTDFLKSVPTDSMASRKEAVMNAIKQEVALSAAQTLMNSVNERCFKACVQKPGTSLGSSEQTCLARCQDRYLEAFNIVRKTYMSRLSKERMEDQANVI